MTATKPATPADNDKKANPEGINFVTLEQIALEMNIPPRDARMLLRLAAKQTKLYPTLGKEHIPRQPWQWRPDSKALEEARKALSPN